MERCKVVLNQYRNGETIDKKTVETVGKSVHSYQPEKCENTVFIIAKKLEEADLKENRISAILQKLSNKLSDVYGKPMGIYSRSEYYHGNRFFLKRKIPAMK